MNNSGSLCLFTVVMNRLHHLEQTLPANIRDNSHPSSYWLILDYSSDDGLQQYILDFFSDELRRGRLQYHRYDYAKYFSHAHSRNLAVQLANARYICNVDADNYTGKDFDKYVLQTFSHHPNTVLSALSNTHKIYGAFGRMAVSRENFMQVGGYDETFDGYGFEDYDLVSRMEQYGLEKIMIEEPGFLKVISHGNEDRVAREWTNDQLLVLFRQQVSNNLQVLLYLFRDQTFHYGVVNEDFAAGTHYRYSLAGDAWQTGTWMEQTGQLRLHFTNFSASFEHEGDYLTGNNHQLKKETRPEELQEAILFHTNMGNSCRYRYNLHNKIIRVNEKGFGRGITQPLFIHQ